MMKHAIADLSILPQETLLQAIQQMDKLMRKLLIITDEVGDFKGVISIGDIQRAILKNLPLDTQVLTVVRSDFKSASTTDDYQEIKDMMLSFRMEYMPVIDSSTGKVAEIIFWEDLFEENFLKRQDMNLESVPVVIMAGGKGTRLQPITNIIPKPLVPIGNKPIVELIIDSFTKHGVDTFYMSVNYKANMIEQYFSDKQKNYEIGYVYEDKPLGTAGSLHLLKEKIDQTFFVTNCDILIDENYANILNYHQENNNLITAVAAIKNYHIPYGTFQTEENGRVTSLDEKPNLNFMVNTGFYILEPNVLQWVPDNEFFHITHLIESVIEKNGRVGIFPVSEQSWHDIGVWDEYNKTQELLAQKKSMHA